MTARIVDAIDPGFEIVGAPSAGGPFVFNSPHSGALYPRELVELSRLPLDQLRRSEDWRVDELFAAAPAIGLPLMRALFPRAYLDLNREAYELDPRVFEGRMPAYANTRSMRVAGGLGTIARVVGDQQEIYRDKLPIEHGLQRIERYHKPYHRALRRLLADMRSQFGVSVLIDCHSMPSSAWTGDARQRPDIVIGDRYGASCALVLTQTIESSLKRLGYRVLRNKPYAGGYNTEHYGAPATGSHAIQIEIARGLYMDEKGFAETAGFTRLQADLRIVIEEIAAIPLELLASWRAAAE